MRLLGLRWLCGCDELPCCEGGAPVRSRFAFIGCALKNPAQHCKISVAHDDDVIPGLCVRIDQYSAHVPHPKQAVILALRDLIERWRIALEVSLAPGAGWKIRRAAIIRLVAVPHHIDHVDRPGFPPR